MSRPAPCSSFYLRHLKSALQCLLALRSPNVVYARNRSRRVFDLFDLAHAVGHILCEACANEMKDLIYKCPFHCTTPASAGYEPVFIDFGNHEVVALGSLEAESGYQLTAHSSDIRSVEAQTLGRLLGEVAKSCPESWSGTSVSGNQKGLVFLRACRLLHKIGDGVQGDDNVKEFLHRLATALGDLKNLYDSMADTIQGNALVRKKLEEMNDSLRDDLANTRKTLREKESWYTEKINSQRFSHSEREEKLRADLSAMYMKWKDEKSRRLAAEETITSLEKELNHWKRHTTRYKKKYQHERIGNDYLREENGKGSLNDVGSQFLQSAVQSDDSLEVEYEHLDSEVANIEEVYSTDPTTPPLSASSEAESASASLPPNQASSLVCVSKNHTDGGSQPSSSLNSKFTSGAPRGIGRAHSVGTVKFSAGHELDLPRPIPDKPTPTQGSNQPSSRVLSRIQASSTQHDASDSSLAPRLRFKTQPFLAKPALDPELLELCPDLLIDSKSYDHPDKRAAGENPRSTRISKTASVPTNPLAIRQKPQSLFGPERKKQRLTMGIGSD
ncbi:hypothetical protein ACEPAF_7906 [Sanghuangporus sanghuang]